MSLNNSLARVAPGLQRFCLDLGEVMDEFKTQFNEGKKKVINYIGRSLTESEENSLFINFLRMKLGKKPIPNSFGNVNRFDGKFYNGEF